MWSSVEAWVSVLLLVLHSVHLVEARTGPVWYLKCNPYTKKDGTQAVGAKGPCDNMCFAGNTGQQPSTITYRGPNNRDTDAGCQKNPCSQSTGLPQYNRFGDSCDEYPLAATYRGPNGFRTLRCVPIAENRNQGGQFKTYLSTQGLNEGDSFPVGAMWALNDPPFYCANKEEGLSNPDKSEFKYTGGAFSNARRHARSLTSDTLFETLSGTVDQVAFRRDFLVSNGEIATLFGPDTGFNVSQFWTDDATPLTIVRQLDFTDVLTLLQNAADS